MAFTQTASILIDRPQADVWEYLNDHSRDIEWRPVKVRPVGTGPVGPGTRFEGEVLIGGRKYPYVNELTEYQPPSRMAWKAVSTTGWWRGQEGSYALMPEGGGTRLTYQLTYVPINLPGRVTAKLVSGLLKVGVPFGLPMLLKDIKKGVERQRSV